MVGFRYLSRLYRSVEHVAKAGIPGHIVECGCAQGGSAALLGLALRNSQKGQGSRKLWLYDTFEGLPAPTASDPDRERANALTGTCRGEFGEVLGLLQSLGVADNAILVKGLFQDTLVSPECFPIAVLNLDGDWYDSIITCLRALYDGVSPGGIIQVDDYLFWQGCHKALDEFMAERKLDPGILQYVGKSVWFTKPQ